MGHALVVVIVEPETPLERIEQASRPAASLS